MLCISETGDNPITIFVVVYNGNRNPRSREYFVYFCQVTEPGRKDKVKKAFYTCFKSVSHGVPCVHMVRVAAV